MERDEGLPEFEPIAVGDEDTLPEVDPDAIDHAEITKKAQSKLLALIDKGTLTDSELTMFRALSSLVTESMKLETARLAAEARKGSGLDGERVRRARGRIGEVRDRMTRAAVGR